MKISFFLCLSLLSPFLASAHSPILTEYEQRDLQLFTTYQQKPGLITAINRTQTAMGQRYLQDQLANPISDIQELQKRQEAIRFLVANQDSYAFLKHKLADFAQHEKSITKSVESDAICNSTIGNFYFKNSYLRWLNKYPAGLEFGQAAHIANLSFPLFEHAIIHFLLSEKLRDHLGIECGGHHHHHDAQCDHHHASTGALAAYNIYNVAHTLIHLAGFKGLIDHVREQNQVVQSMQQELINLKSCLDSARHIYEFMEKSTKGLNPLVPGFAKLATLFESNPANRCPQLQEFLTLINRTTFEGSPSFFSRQGIILRTYALAKEVNAELQDSLKAIAEIDFYVSNTQLYKEYQNTTTPFTFAHYTAQESPLISISGFWNPLLASMQPIQQEINVGTNNPRIAIVTGPNKAGKSTGLNAISIAMVLAQTLGITPASSCSLTPFSCIKTGFNMTARVNQDQSLFSASLDFAQSSLDYAKSHPHEPIFIAIDELFNSTAFEQGSAIAKQFCQELAACKNCICLMATHFDALTALEKENPALYKNYKAELVRNNNAHEQYILEPGISEPSNVLRLVEQENLGIKFV